MAIYDHSFQWSFVPFSAAKKGLVINMADISILGAGGWGMALANSFSSQGNRTLIWSAFQSEIDFLISNRGNEKLLPGITLDKNIRMTADICDVAGSDIVVIAVPSFAVRETAKKLSGVICSKTVVVNVAKGFEKSTLKCLSEVIAEELPDNRLVVLSGPSHAEEVARGVPTSLVAASTDRLAAEYVQDTLFSPTLRIYTHDDVIGVEVGGALKNVIAVCYGICDGLKLGDNAKAALMTRGLTEIARLGVRMGARTDTFAGLTGIGDLIVTCLSMHSRNHRFGIYIAEGCSAEEALEKVGMTVEGYHAAAIIVALSEKYGVEMPIAQQCYNILYNNIAPQTAIAALMQRPQKNENETSWIC